MSSRAKIYDERSKGMGGKWMWEGEEKRVRITKRCAEREKK